MQRLILNIIFDYREVAADPTAMRRSDVCFRFHGGHHEATPEKVNPTQRTSGRTRKLSAEFLL